MGEVVDVQVEVRCRGISEQSIGRGVVYRGSCGMYVHYRDGIVVEDGRNIFRRELVCGIADEQARLTDGTVADDDTPVAS